MVAKRKAKIDPLPEEFATWEEAAEFWDTHDVTDYLAFTRPVKNLDIDIKRRYFVVELEPALARSLKQAARQRKVAPATLVKLWLREKLALREKPKKRIG